MLNNIIIDPLVHSQCSHKIQSMAQKSDDEDETKRLIISQNAD